MTQPVRDIYVTAAFGRPGSWAAGYHTGIDYRAAVGTPILATRYGKVIHTGWGGYGNAYGNHVIVQSLHKGRRIQHLYAHLSDATVRKGQKVKAGSMIGLSGNTGNTTGPHLHYEERVAPFGYYNHINPVLPNWQPVRQPKVNMKMVNAATKPNSNIKKIQRRLNKEFPRWKRLRATGKWDERTERRFKAYQRRIGYPEKKVNGKPDPKSLRQLGFKVV